MSADIEKLRAEIKDKLSVAHHTRSLHTLQECEESLLRTFRAALVSAPQAVSCPHCGKGTKRTDHLWPGCSFGPWYCDECGGSFTGRIEADGSAALERRAERKVATIDVLVLPPQTTPVYFVVEGMRFESVAGQRDADEAEHKRYFYESHSCPTNWLRPEMVYADGDADPHGLIEFVATVDADTLPPDEAVGPNARDAALVRLIENHANPAVRAETDEP